MKKGLKITIVVISVIIIFFVVSISMLINKGYGLSVGRYLEDKNGTAILIRENTPILLSSQHNGDMFYKLDIGDRILVIHTGIEESYPAKTSAKKIFKIGNGSIDDIPKKVIKQLTELGWIEQDKFTYEELNEMSADKLLDLFIQNGLVINDELKESFTDEELQTLFKENFHLWHTGVSAHSHTMYIDIAEQTKLVYDKIIVE